MKALGILSNHRADVIRNIENTKYGYQTVISDQLLSAGLDSYYYITIPTITGYNIKKNRPAVQKVDTVFISEPVINYIVYNSRKPKAIIFRKLLYTEIIPTIKIMESQPYFNNEFDNAI